MKQIGILITLLLFLGSCAFHSGMITPVGTQTSKSQKYVDIAVGYSKASYFMGLGGTGKNALINDAKRNMFLSYKLKPGQSFENISLDIKSTCILLYQKREIIVIADVVEEDSTMNITYSDHYLNLLSSKKTVSNNLFSLNEEVIYLDKNNVARKGKIVKLSYEDATIFYVNSKANFKIKHTSTKKIFKISSTEQLEQKFKFKIGQEVVGIKPYKNSQGYTLSKKDGIIVGLNAGFILLKISENFYVTDKIENLKSKL
jgi:hypothetical protein